MKRLKFNLQLFGKDFAEAFAESIGLGAQESDPAAHSTADDKDKQAEPVSQPSEKVDEPKGEETNEPKVDEPKERDLEKDAAFAKLRRENAALEKKLKAEQEERDQWYASQFGEYGIKSETEYRERLKAQREAELLEKAEQGDTDAVDELATIKADELVEQKLKAKELELELEREVLELNSTYKLDLKSIEDIANIDKGDEIIAIMSAKKPNGEYFTAGEAYRMVNADTLIEQAVKSAKQQLKNEQAGYNHTKVDTKAGSEHETMTLPSEVLGEFDKWGMKPDMKYFKK